MRPPTPDEQMRNPHVTVDAMRAPASQSDDWPRDNPMIANNFTLHAISSRAGMPWKDGKALLQEHVTMMYGRMVANGGPDFDRDAHFTGFWDKLDQVLPPEGRYYIARGVDGAALGTGSLRTVAPGVGEMKHLYVRATARRAGLGRALVRQRMADAREMGLKTLIADTFAVNAEMLALYDSLGFRRVAPFTESATYTITPELAPHMVFLRRDLSD